MKLSKIDNKINQLFGAILLLKDPNEARRFFRDLLTEKELREFANRWQVAQLLNKKVPYIQIERKTGMSSTTIARVQKWLTKGMGGYHLMLNKAANHHHNPSAPFEKGLC